MICSPSTISTLPESKTAASTQFNKSTTWRRVFGSNEVLKTPSLALQPSPPFTTDQPSIVLSRASGFLNKLPVRARPLFSFRGGRVSASHGARLTQNGSDSAVLSSAGAHAPYR